MSEPCHCSLDDIAAKLEAVGNPTRLSIYRALIRAGDSGLTVGQLQGELGGALSTLSHHLHRLITVELVTQERNGTSLICRANYPAMHGLVQFLTDECCIDEAVAPPSLATVGF